LKNEEKDKKSRRHVNFRKGVLYADSISAISVPKASKHRQYILFHFETELKQIASNAASEAAS